MAAMLTTWVCGTAAEAQDRCATASQPLFLSQDSIGPIGLAESIEAIKRHCPEARDTVRASDEGHRSPAVTLQIGNISALAVQFSNSLEGNRAPDLWIITGSGAVLPGDVRLDGTLRQLRAAYGEGEGTAELGDVRVRFDSMPRMWFLLDVPPSLVGSIEVTGDLSSIPDTAAITKVLITQLE